ncbi:MAG: hypothetical protein AABZ32_07795 [Bacteroidota bacterium]
MAQVYGYLVCLVTVITFLICTTTMINAVIDLGDPIHAGFTRANDPSLASFENYKMDMLKTSQSNGESSKASYTPDDQTLRAMYESAKSEKIQKERHDANRTIIVDSILIAICFLLFGTHWKWMRKLARTET